MSQVVNLRRARKKKARDAKARDAAERRRQFGQPKSERLRQSQETAREDRAFEGHRLGDTDSAPEDES